MVNSQPKISPAKSHVARRLILYIVLFSSFITIITTAVQLYRDYNTDLDLINSELQQIEAVHLNSLTSALWASNRELLQTSIDGILKIRDMQYVEIRDEERVWASAGEKINKTATHDQGSGGNTIHRQYSLEYPHRNKNIDIGRLEVIVSLEGVYQRLIDKVWVILISNAVKISLIATFIYFLFLQLVARHLSRIAHFAESDDPLQINKPLTLNRNTKKYDEFDVVVDSINDMHNRLHEQIAAAEEQKQHLAQTLNSIGDAVIATDINGNVTRMNPVAQQLTGWSLDEARGKSLKVIFPIIDASTRLPIENPVDKVIATGKTVYLSNHTTLIAKDGTEYQIADSAAAIRESNTNSILGMVLVFNDVTEAYKLRMAAAESAKKYRTLATVVPIGIFHTDSQGNCLYVNKTWCEIAGISAEEAKGDGWVAALHPEDKEFIFTEWNKATNENRPFQCEYRFQPAGGVARWVLGQAIVEKGENGEVVGYVGSITDISHHKKAEEAVRVSEQRLADAQRMAHIGNWELDLITNKLQWSDEIFHIFEMDPSKFDASYEAFLKAIHPDDRERVNKAYTESLKNKRPYSIEHRLRMLDGRIKKVIERCETSYDEQGNPVLSCGTVQDITEQANLEEAVRRSQKMDALGKLTGGIAHDYNNMLGIILGYTDLLADGIGGQPELVAHTQQIQRAAERGSKLTKKLLAFSRHKAINTESVDINNLLLEERHLLEKTLTARIQLTLDLAEDLWPVNLDGSDLEDAIVNMGINAMHATKANGEFTLRTSNEQLSKYEASQLHLKQGDYVLLSITDTGCGMDTNTKERIFDPFFSTKGERGTGLGLSQVYGFVERSNGAIKVYSEPGHGTRFALYFPRGNETPVDSQASTQNMNHSLQGTETLLVVDDEPGLLSLAQEILSSQGYRVLTANDGEQALKILEESELEKTLSEKEGVSLIISDVIMPVMDGYQLAAQVQERYPHIKLQMVSGFADDRHNGIADDALYQNMLYKPYSSKALLQSVRSLLDASQAPKPQN
jgi:PAS domain S-box-containing protein